MSVAADLPSPRVLLHQIVWSPETLAAIDPDHPVLDNLANDRSDWREYWPMRRFLLGTALDEDCYYGFLSPKFRAKTLMGLSEAAAFVRAQAPRADVVLFSPQPDMGAFFLNVFEQAEIFYPGQIEAYEAFLAHIGQPASLGTMIMDSRQVVFSNYFAARPAFWRAWLAVNEALFAICEGPDSDLRRALCHPTAYPGAVQRKVFLMERVASLLLVTQPGWRSVACNPFTMGWSASRLSQFRTEAMISDALKMAFRDQPFPQYMEAYATVRDRFRAGAMI